MDSNYYVPELEEFHLNFKFEAKVSPPINMEEEVGKFEFQILPIEWRDVYFSWEMMNFPVPMPFHLLSLLGEDRVRVKYLDIEDIESFDFKLLKEEEEFLLFESYKTFLGAGTGDDRKLIISYNVNTNEIWVYWKANRGTEDMLHEGYCKNKSELRKLLKNQLRIPHLSYE